MNPLLTLIGYHSSVLLQYRLPLQTYISQNPLTSQLSLDSLCVDRAHRISLILFYPSLLFSISCVYYHFIFIPPVCTDTHTHTLKERGVFIGLCVCFSSGVSLIIHAICAISMPIVCSEQNKLPQHWPLLQLSKPERPFRQRQITDERHL